MCGIVGIIAKSNRFPYFIDNVFTNMLMDNSIRGADSTGVFGVTGGNRVDMLKGNADGYLFCRSLDYEKFFKRIYNSYRIVIGHNRKATKGSIKPENAHPFKESNIYLVHNGNMRNSDTVDKNVEVDSMAIAKALQQHDAVEGLKKIDGAYALAWYDQEDQTLNLARNSERPLRLLEYDDFWVISSEIGLPLWLFGRMNHKPKAHREVEPRKILSFSLDSLAAIPREIPYEEFSHFHATPKIVTPPAIEYKPAEKVTQMSYPANKSAPPKPANLTVGDPVLVRVDDYSAQNNESILIGHPMFDGEVDENIFVRVQLKSTEKILDYIEASHKADTYFECKVMFWKTMAGRNVLFANNPTTRRIVFDAGHQMVDVEEVTEVLSKEKCKSCSEPLNLADISSSIARKVKTGGWRLLCKACLAKSQEKADQNQQERQLQSVH